jgi:hypothetical protein
MNENAKKWLAALRSGEYQQGQKFLAADKKYCCLGVACDLYSKENPEFQVTQVTFTGKPCVGFGPLKEISLLPREVAVWLGTKGICPSIASEKGMSVANLNDQGSTFTEIAELIEKNEASVFEVSATLSEPTRESE